MNHVDLFSGIGGFSLGLERTGGFKTVAFCEIEKFPKEILRKHWPNVKQYDDIKELTNEKLKTDGIGPVDILTCGYPCQPFSNAGLKKGEQDPRHLWPDCFRLIKECRPTWVIGENVSGHIKLGLDSVLSDLESQGYGTRTFSVSAASVGANHKRERVWVLAYSERNHDFNKKQRIDGEEKEIPREHWEKNSESRQSSGTSSIRETGSEHVENTGRSSGGIESSRNKESVGSRPSEETKWTANTDQVARPSSGTKIMADTVSGNVEAGRERQRTLREGHQGEGVSDHVASCGEDVADANSERRRVWETDGKDATNAGKPSGSAWEGWWDLEPNLGRVAHGVPNRVAKLKALGNSLIPFIPYLIGKSILETYKNES